MSTSFDDHQDRIKQERYERFLDAMMAQSGSGQPQADRPNSNPAPLNLPSMADVLRLLHADPLAVTVFQAKDEPEPFAPTSDPPPDHFIDRFAWNITRNIFENLRQAERPAWERRKAKARQGHVRTVDFCLCRIDPLYHRTIQALEAELRRMGPGARRILARKFLKNPTLFLEIYQEQRQVAALVESILHERRTATLAR